MTSGLARFAPVLLTFCLSCVAARPAERQPKVSEAPGPFHDLLVTPERCAGPAAVAVSRAQALADLKVVERVIEGGYSGYDVLAAAGVDWDRALRDAASELAALPEPIAVEDFRLWLPRKLAVAGDNHLAFWTVSADGKWRWKSTGSHQDAWAADLVVARREGSFLVVEGPAPLAGSVLLGCTGRPPDEVLRPTVRGDPPEPAWLVLQLAAAQPPPVECRFRRPDGTEHAERLAFHRLRFPPKDPRGAPTFERHDGQVVRLRLRRLGKDSKEELDAFVATAAQLRSAPAIVLDVRGNQGGSDTYVRDWFAGLTAGELRYHAIDELQSDVTLQGQANDLACRLAVESDSDRRALLGRQYADWRGILERSERELGRSYKDWLRSTPVDQGAAPAPYAGALVVLTDAGCTSACESLVMYARQLPGTVVVGENTGGAGVFGEVHRYRLPQSGIFMQAGAKWFHDPSPGAVAEEGKGYLPDIWLDTEEAPAAAEAIAACLASGPCRNRLRPD